MDVFTAKLVFAHSQLVVTDELKRRKRVVSVYGGGDGGGEFKGHKRVVNVCGVGGEGEGGGGELKRRKRMVRVFVWVVVGSLRGTSTWSRSV